jgi:ABC-type antimicrobial peptide transport system permease subunit
VGTAGVLAGEAEDYDYHSYSVYCDIELYIKQLKRTFGKRPIPGQPTTKSGKAYKAIYYNEIYVRVDDINNVEAVQKQIRELGYRASSDAEYIKSQQKQFQSIQLVLGGIGAVSLFVAAIGIANTMMMSIYERTKEIGVIKVLGCNLSNIRSMFLMEAAFIGFIGGTIGLALSYTISIVLNKVGASFLGEFMMVSGDGAVASHIPLWLALLALVFAMFVGIVAGFFPALRAMRLSPLAAIRTE